MRISRALAVLLLAAATASGDPLWPTKEAMTWEFAVSDEPPETAGRSVATVRIAGAEERGGKSLCKTETREGQTLINTDLIAEDESGVHLYERKSGDGKAIIFDPPQTLTPGAPKVGDTWEIDARASTTHTRERYTIAAEELVGVPAGSFHALRFHSEQPWPITIAVDRWFAPGFGFVKEVTTTRGPTGRLLSRRTMVLKKLVETAPPPDASPSSTPEPATGSAGPANAPDGKAQPAASVSPVARRVRLEASSDREGEPRTDFSSDTANIFIQWAGEGLPVNATARVVWIAEDVGDIAPPNFVVDETETTVTRAEFAARFTLSRPRDGWAAGKYRIQLYLDDALVETLKVTIHD